MGEIWPVIQLHPCSTTWRRDGSLRQMGQSRSCRNRRRAIGAFAFTAHSVVFAEADPAWIRGQLPPGDLAAPILPAFLQALAGQTMRRVTSHDLLCVATPLTGPPPLELSRRSAHGPGSPLSPGSPLDPGSVTTGTSYPRVARAMRYRNNVRAWRAADGVVLVGRGVAGRWETAIEVDPGSRGRGLGRELAAAARHLARPGPRSGLRSHRATRPACGRFWRRVLPPSLLSEPSRRRRAGPAPRSGQPRRPPAAGRPPRGRPRSTQGRERSRRHRLVR